MSVYPIFDKMHSRAQKEALLNQKGKVIWMTGLSGAGKSTIAVALENSYAKQKKYTVLLDGDNVRTGICAGLSFSEEDRVENIRRIAEVAKLFKENGAIVICSFVSPTENLRQMAKTIIGQEDFVEVFINTSLEVCEARDTKGLYAKARAGLIKDFTGINAPFEAPTNPDFIVNTETMELESIIEILNPAIN